MKIAVIGTGPMAIEMAIQMHSLEAEVVLFGAGKLGGGISRNLAFSSLSMEGGWESVTTEIGRELTGLGNSDKVPSLEEYYRQYLKKLIQYCEEHINVKNFNVERVQKRFLSLTDEVPSKSRLDDLFRVVHLREDDTGKIEFFDDFDIVIEAIGATQLIKAGPAGGFAINEKLNFQEIEYKVNQETISRVLDFKGTLVIIGEGIESATFLLFLKSWLGLNPENNIYLIQESLRPFDKLVELSPILDEEVSKFINEEKIYWQTQCRDVEAEVESYRVLPREEQIKFRMPEFPDPRLKILTGYTATSIDNLTDREGLFITLETPSWKGESNREIFTLNSGMLFVLRGAGAHYLAENLRVEKGPIHLEAGYYTLGQNFLAEKNQFLLKEALPSITEIRDNILSFFTRVE